MRKSGPAPLKLDRLSNQIAADTEEDSSRGGELQASIPPILLQHWFRAVELEKAA